MSNFPLKAANTVQETPMSLTVAGAIALAGEHPSVWRCCANRATHVRVHSDGADATTADMFVSSNSDFFLDVGPNDTVSVLLATGEVEAASSLWATKQSGAN